MMNTPAAPLSALFVMRSGRAVERPLTDPLAREHALAWADETSFYGCAVCSADLPRGFVHTNKCSEFFAVWP